MTRQWKNNDIITPISTPFAAQEKESDEGVWKIVTRKNKDKGKSIATQSSVVHIQFGSGLPGGTRGPNPICLDDCYNLECEGYE